MTIIKHKLTGFYLGYHSGSAYPICHKDRAVLIEKLLVLVFQGAKK